MDRDIKTAAPGDGNEYLQRLYKLIPTEITAAYLAISALLADTSTAPGPATGFAQLDVYLFWAFCILFILVPIYMRKVQQVTTPLQIIATTISFPIWAANVSAALLFQYFHIPPAALGALLILWTTMLPVFVR